MSLQHIRIATAEEVDRIREGSDVGGEPFAVYAFGEGDAADLVVVKQVVEMDPVWFAKSSNDVRKARFIQLMEERLMGAGVQRYGCRVSAADERWRKVLVEWGFKEQSSEPEIQMMRNLNLSLEKLEKSKKQE